MVYVDPLQDFGWVLRGHRVHSCHLFTDSLDLDELHRVAACAGMQRRWFQNGSRVAPHYDLTQSRRLLAVRAGAVEVSRREAVAIWRARRALIAGQAGADKHSAATIAEQGDPKE